MEAVGRAHFDIVTALLEVGADPRRPDRWGRSPMDAAIRRGSVGHAQRLVSRGASYNEVDPQGMSILLRAVRLGNLPLVEHLVLLGAKDIPGPDGATAVEDAKRLRLTALAHTLERVLRLVQPTE